METERQMQRIIVTGTMAYGPASNKSDIDIVMLSGDAMTLEKNIEKTGVSIKRVKDKNLAYLGYKFEIPPMPPINIIIVESYMELDSWEFATNKMKNILPIKGKADRVRIFSEFRDQFLLENQKSFDPFEDI